MKMPMLSIAQTPAATFVAVEGKGLRRHSEQVKSLFDQFIREDESRKFVLVLDHCEYLDSTFLGSLVQMSKHHRGLSQNRLEIIGDEKMADRLFGPCNLQHYLPVSESSRWPLPTQWRAVEVDPTGEAGIYHQMEAHESLAELDIPDAPAFRRVADSIRKGLQGLDT